MTLTTEERALGDGFASLLGRVHVHPSTFSATVDDESLEAPDLRQLESDLGRRLYERLHVGWPSGRNSLARIDRDLALEAEIARRVPASDIDLEVTDVRSGRERTTALLMGARVILDDGPSSTVRLPDSWPALSPGFYMVFGALRPRTRTAHSLWRIYLSANVFGDSVELFARAVHYLRSTDARWQAKIASSEAVYPRTDAVTVYLDHEDRRHADVLAGIIGAQAGRSNRVSAFVSELAPGVGLAQEPADPDPTRRGLSYGQHRASILARAAIESATGAAVNLPDALRAAGVDPRQYWRNHATTAH